MEYELLLTLCHGEYTWCHSCHGILGSIFVHVWRAGVGVLYGHSEISNFSWHIISNDV